MADRLQHQNSTTRNGPAPPAEFIAACALAFAASLVATAHFCRSMWCEMKTPGGWTNSELWMRIAGPQRYQTAPRRQHISAQIETSTVKPSPLPTLLITQR